MSDQIDRTLRAAMGTIVEVAPEAPEVPTVPSAVPARSMALRYVLVGFAVTAAFAMVGLLFFERDSATSADTIPIDTPARPADLLLFPREGVEGLSLGEVVGNVHAWDGVEFATSWSGEQAYEEYLRQFPHEERESMVYLAEFPGSVRVWTTGGFDGDAAIAAAEGWGYEVSGPAEFIPLVADPAAFDPDTRVFLAALDIDLPTEAYNPPTIWVYGTDLESTPLRRLWIEETNYDGGIEGILPDDPAGVDRWTKLAVPTGTALIAQGAVGPMIVWESEPGGPVIRVSGLGLTAESLTDIVLSLEPTPDGWLPSALPDDLEELVTGWTWRFDGLNVNQTVWPTMPGEQSQPLLLLQQMRGGADAVEVSLFGLVGRTTSPDAYAVDVIDVRGHPAIRVVYPEGGVEATFLVWSEGSDHLVTVFITGTPVGTVLDSLYQLSVDQWEALRQRRLNSGESSPTTTMAPTTTVTTTAQAGTESALDWTSLGVSMSDDEFLALEPTWNLVPGTARRLHWATDDGLTTGLLAAQVTESENSDPLYCLIFHGSTTGDGVSDVGGTQCSRTIDGFAEMLSAGVGGSSSCVAPVAHMWDVWGVPTGTDVVRFEFSDGSIISAEVTDGFAQVMLTRDVAVEAITFDGASDTQLAQIADLVEHSMTCAEMNGG